MPTLADPPPAEAEPQLATPAPPEMEPGSIEEVARRILGSSLKADRPADAPQSSKGASRRAKGEG